MNVMHERLHESDTGRTQKDTHLRAADVREETTLTTAARHRSPAAPAHSSAADSHSRVPGRTEARPARGAQQRATPAADEKVPQPPTR